MGRELRSVTVRFAPVQPNCCCVARFRRDRLPARMGQRFATLPSAALRTELERHSELSKVSDPVE
jgi:hypothetical protein